MTTATAPLSLRLKESGRELHTKAEKQPFQQSLVRGAITRGTYASWLAQMLHVHARLEAHLRDLAEADPRVAAVVTPEQHQEPYLRADLAALDAPADVPALPSVAAFVATIEDASRHAPLRLLGFHYVLEGSNNGNTFIARAVRPALGLVPGQGDRYLDPYGERQRAVWSTFKDRLDEQVFNEDEQRTIVAAAQDMFSAIINLSNELPAG